VPERQLGRWRAALQRAFATRRSRLVALLCIVLLTTFLGPFAWRHLRYKHVKVFRNIEWPPGTLAVAIRSCTSNDSLLLRTGGAYSGTEDPGTPYREDQVTLADDYYYYVFDAVTETLQQTDQKTWDLCNGLVEDRPYNGHFPADYQSYARRGRLSEYYKRYVAKPPVGGTEVSYLFTEDLAVAAVISSEPRLGFGVPFGGSRRIGPVEPHFLQFLSLAEKQWLGEPLVLPWKSPQGLLWSRDGRFFVVSQDHSVCIVPVARYRGRRE